MPPRKTFLVFKSIASSQTSLEQVLLLNDTHQTFTEHKVRRIIILALRSVCLLFKKHFIFRERGREKERE